jgi:Holliday junction resolvasome RuvABC endonuclease subunit
VLTKLRVLGLDTSSKQVGWAVVGRGKERPVLIDHGLLTLNKKMRHPERMCCFESFVKESIIWHGVHKVAIEDLKSLQNAKTGRILQNYIAAAIMATWKTIGCDATLIPQSTAHKRIGVKTLNPQQKKNLTRDQITEYNKKSVLTTINRAFNLKLGVQDFDVSDAIAIGMAGLAGP